MTQDAPGRHSGLEEIRFYYGSHLDPQDWAQRHQIGDAPDLWPYGLDQLQHFSTAQVTPLQVRDLRARDIPRIIRNSPARGYRDLSRIAATWEEDSALRLPLVEPVNRRASGVIWLTDRIVTRSHAPKDLLLKTVLKGFDLLWVLSKAQIPILEKWLGARRPKIAFLPFGIDYNFFSYSPYPERPRILSIGSDRDRDHETLLKAMTLVHEARPQVEIVVQSNSERATPSAIRRIDKVGHAALRDLYASASITVVATRPNVHVSGMTVALESLAVGRPVVITDTPGMADYVREGVDGHRVPPGDFSALAERTIQLIDQREKSLLLGRHGSDHVKKEHTSRSMAKHLSDLFADLV